MVLELSLGWQVGYATCRSIGDLGAQGAYGVADTGGRAIDSCNIDQSLVPASVIKIATVLAGLRILGPEFRFSTEFYIDNRANLYIKGFGDPTLMPEEIGVIVEQLRQKKVSRVQTLFIDTSAFSLTMQVPGQENSARSYDAPVGPLSVNFNSVPLRKDATGRIESGEPLTPTLPIMQELGQDRPPGQHRVNICVQGCDPDARMAQYAGELFAALLQKGGIPVAALGGVRAVPPQGAELLYAHRSTQTLWEISRSLLHYSSNFMANLVFLTCGAKQFGYPATWKKAQLAVHQELAHQLGTPTASSIVQVEGAGLSRQNRVTARAMLQLLTRFQPYMELLKKERGTSLKTGTLTGVYNYAGYLPGGKAFVILLNQQANSRAAVLERLQRQHAVPLR
jgi:D-alanyl-D-alanine carboxypeptidase/D-alanyl-D-alanine-endopeptidase (penicillin-binding protein 4)